MELKVYIEELADRTGVMEEITGEAHVIERDFSSRPDLIKDIHPVDRRPLSPRLKNRDRPLFDN